ncbi:hypothetical protein BaRGS_00001293 [Batillaria attramentaria]|uniref:G-protein coupled receptors family 1 profile domain-containing protein n=1 Tax=Batillaria attramentaria TaxID=370345 RepID=A0ABD0M794_9CAEN
MQLFENGFKYTIIDSLHPSHFERLVKTLRSRTNFVIGSLAVADMLTGLLVPLNAAHEVTDFHPNMCAAALGALTFGATVSMQHLMVISVDRFVAVSLPGDIGDLYRAYLTPNPIQADIDPGSLRSRVTGYPTRYRDIVTYKRLGVVVGIIWPLQFVLGFLPLFGVRNRDWDEVHCKLFELIAIWQLHLLIVVSVVCPLTIMSICYVRVFILSRRRFKRIQAMATTAAALSGWNQTMKKVKATAGLCVYFLLSWTPYGVIAAIMAATKQETVPPYWVDISLTVGFGNSFGNPVLYFLSQKSARDAVKETFWPKAKKHTPSVRLLTINVKPAAAGGTGSVATEGGSVSREGTRSTHV